MLRKLLFAGLAGNVMLVCGCAGSRVQNLTKATEEALLLVKQEAQRAIKLTEQKVKNSEVDEEIGQQIITNLETTEKKVDAQLVQVNEIQQSKNREEI